MSIQVSCPGRDCDQTLTLSPDMAGKKGKCPKCGMSFQIPKNLGAGKGKQSSSAAKPVAKPPAATPKPKSRPRRGPEKIDADEMASMLVDDDDDAGFVEESVEDYDDYDAAPRRRPRRRERDDYDDDDDDYRDEDDYVPRRRGGKSGGMSKAKRWKLTSVGMLIVAISMCVIGGATALTFISELLMQVALASGSNFGGTMRGSINVLKIGQVFALIGGVGLMVGYVFSVFVPNKHGSLGLSIAAIVLGVTNFVLQLIFVQIPALRDTLYGFSGHIYSRSVYAGWVGGFADGGDEVLSFFLELGRAAEFLVFAFFLAAAARTLGDRRHRQDCMRVVYFLGAYAGLLLFMYIFMFIGGIGTGKWLLYVVRILNWLANGLIGTVLVFYIMNLFYSAKSSE